MEQNQSDELVALYISECDKLLTLLDKIIAESDAADKITDAPEMFRVLHTIKGSSAMMGYDDLTDLSHRFEDVLSIIKKSHNIITVKQLQSVIETGAAFSAYMHAQFTRIHKGENVNKENYPLRLLNNLEEILNDDQTFSSKIAKSEPLSAVNKNAVRLKVMLKNCPLPHIRAHLIAKSVKSSCTYLVTEPKNIIDITDRDNEILNNGFELRLVPNENTNITEITEKLLIQPYVESCNAITDSESDVINDDAAELVSSVILSQATVNELIHFIDELSTEVSSLENHTEQIRQNNGKTRDLLAALKHTVRETGVLASQIGTHSIKSVFIQMQLIVRNMARELGKSIKIQLSGTDIQVDRSVLDIISDCLIHIVRNAVDHGIEPPSERKEKEKSETGTISISASKNNDYLYITVSDDGRGIKFQDVLDSADKQGLLKKSREEYTDTEIANMLFFSGMTTKNNITRYSGRGVGLDTVMRRVRQAGGRVTVESVEGIKTTFTLKIPISLMVVDGIEVTDGCNQFIVPANALHHISISDNYSSGQIIEYDSICYFPLTFPGMSDNDETDGQYILFLMPDFGQYYLRVQKISMVSSYYVKSLPNCVSDKLGNNNVFSGCVLVADSCLRCILDAQKLISANELSSIKEVQL